MHKLILILFSLFFFLSNGFSQEKKVRIKSNKSIRFIYQKDSTCLSKKENSRIMETFYSFYKAVEENDSVMFINLLSTKTIERIQQRLGRKFKRLIDYYKVDLAGKVYVQSVQSYKIKKGGSELSQIYLCIVKLPNGQSINKRVGFDPISRFKVDNLENLIALLLVKTNSVYKVVINH